MNLDCDIVMDCVSIYKDGLASEGTARAVNQHLKNCAECRKFYRHYDSINAISTKNQRACTGSSDEKFAELSKALKVRRNIFAALFVAFTLVTTISVIFGIIMGRKRDISK
ncbi:MAG: zf-HC2 domain-containing protein [Clostridiales bacterium]|nr:zf-HC2 domain-containing protein [Clostridiales bacterium]